MPAASSRGPRADRGAGREGDEGDPRAGRGSDRGGHGRVGALVGALVADGVAFALLAWVGGRAALLACDGVIGPGRAAAELLVVLAAGVGLERLARPHHRRRAALGSLAVLAGLPAVLAAAATSTPTQGASYLWLAQEWAKLPANLVLLARLGVPAALAAVASVGVIAALAARPVLGPRRALAPLAWIVLLGALLSGIAAGARILVYWVVYLGPWMAATAGLAGGWPRVATRAATFGAATSLLLVYYVGVLPLGHARFAEEPGVRRVYPPPGERAAVPLAFLRAFEVDPEAGVLYTAYGPTSGLLRLDLAAAELTELPTPDGLVRELHVEAGRPDLHALDWVRAELIRVGRSPFEVLDRVPLFAPERAVPMSFALSRDRLALVVTEPPSVWELDRWSDRPLRSLDLRALGLTRFRSGAWTAVGGYDAGFLAFEIGAVDAAGRYRMARLDLETFTLTAAAIPDGGLAIHWAPARGAIYAAGFFTDRLFELDQETLELRRTFRGPLNCRAIVHDAARGLLWASAFLPGELWALDADTGAVVRRARVGNKSLSLALAGDRLWVGSRDGIFEVDLEAFLGAAGRSRPGAITAIPREGSP